MSQILIDRLTFCYEGAYEPVFQDACFQLDTQWKLGFIGRNGRGKTTLLRLLAARGAPPYQYSGSITASVEFEYFPYSVEPQRQSFLALREVIAPFHRWEQEMDRLLEENTPQSLERYGELLSLYQAHEGYRLQELMERELGRLGVQPEVLERPLGTLSQGERTKLMLAALFLKKNSFLLIDEPTNHLDEEGRKTLAAYLRQKSGFILVSHDRRFVDEIVDHVLSVNRKTIEVQRGNYSSWQENKDRQDVFEWEKNQRLKKEIRRLEAAAREKAGWSDKIEATKIGGHTFDRGAIGHKAAKMMKRSKAIEQRQERAIEEKTGLLKDLEKHDPLGLQLLPYPKERVLELRDVTVAYPGGKPLFRPVSLTVRRGDRVLLKGGNGSGKTSLFKAILGELEHEGSLQAGSGLIISQVAQDSSFLTGTIRELCQREGLEESLVKAILRKLDVSRAQLERELSTFSEGQKKKVLLARSLATPAHLFLWDEPLNYIDLLSRIQLEELILEYAPTLLFVEHDRAFQEKVATQTVVLQK